MVLTLKIVATLVIRDEQDIIKTMIEHSLNEGISKIFVTNNNSKDNTVKILEKFPEVEIFYSDDMSHNQEAHTTRMARLASKLKPDWILHLDADEFWLGLNSLKDLENRHEKAFWSTCAYVHAPSDPINFYKMKNYIDFLGYAKEYKVLHRPDPDVIVEHGNHKISNLGEMGLATGVYRHHYPIRSYNQFYRKVNQGAQALQSRGFNCERWNLWYDKLKSNELRELYDYIAKSLNRYDVGDNVLEDDLRNIMQNYGVMPSLIEETIKSFKSGENAIIRSWVPDKKIMLF